jgi:methylmalonyl-CoA mutase
MDSLQENKNQEKLFNVFPPVTTEEWEALIKKDLKGADYERKLIWKTIEGFDVKPYYRAEDLAGLEYLKAFPGDFPFVRSGRKRENNWFIRQDLKTNNIGKANKKALDILMRGVDSLGFILDNANKMAVDDIENLMENIYATMVEVNFICGPQAPEVFEIYLELVKKYNRDLQKIHGSVDFNPLAQLILCGDFYNSEDSDFEACRHLIENAQHVPHFRTLEVDASIFKNSGSSIVEELAFGLACGNEYLTKLTDKGVSVDSIAANLKFRFGVGSNYFMEIAKIRAARLLWAKIVNVYSPSDAEFTRAFIHSVTSDWNKTMYDPHANLLRTTTEAMSAIIGGTNSLTVRPYNAIYEKPTAFTERIARNQQLLLKEESHFDKIVDPSAGSYYIENLTNSIAEQAWKLFLEVDELGGFIKAFKKGFVQDKINETARKKDMDIATRKNILLGTNQYPNFNEFKLKEFETGVFQKTNHTVENPLTETLKPYRGAQGFERLRYKTDKFALAHRRPQAFMFTYGNLAMRRARSQFSGNFFACAGFEIIDNNGFKTIDEGVNTALNSKAEIVVICATDDDYPLIVPEIFKHIGDKAIVVVAGYPKESIDELKSIGIKHFIHLKSNVLETLREFQEILEIS